MFFASCLSVAQNTILKIVDETQEPFQNVAVYKQTKLLGFSNEKGLFKIQFAESLITLQHPSYRIKKIKILGMDTQKVVLLPKPNEFQAFVINAKRKPELSTRSPLPVFIVNSRQIAFSLPKNAADAMGLQGDAYIQKSQLGGGSPMIRGFAANRILLMVDGVRLNHALFRGGNLHNTLMIDPFALKNIEITNGSNAVIYGSDALGGVIHANFLSNDFVRKKNVEGKLSSLYFSPSQGHSIHADITMRKNNFSLLSSITRQKFSSLMMGNNGPEIYLRNSFVKRVNGQDSIYKNLQPKKQIGTAYSQINFIQKVAYKHSNRLSFNYGLYLAQTSSIPRYDRLILEDNKNQLVNAQWDYSPQKWMMNRFEVKLKEKTKLFNHANFIYAHQYNLEGRVYRKLNSTYQNVLKDKVQAHSINLDAIKKFGATQIFYGAEWLINSITSNGIQNNIVQNTSNKIQSRYPDNSYWTSLGLYTKIKKHWFQKSMFFEYGTRLTRVQSKANLGRFFIANELNSISQENWNLSQSIGLVKWFSKKHKVSSNLSTGFRAPNIDDLSKIFDSEPGKVIVPNPTLKPEKTYNIDLGWQANFFKKNQLYVGGFYTKLNDAMARQNSQINGLDSMLYMNVLSQVQRLENIASGEIIGVKAKFKCVFKNEIVLHGQATFINGKQSNGSSLRHVTPNFGHMALRKYFGSHRLEVLCQWNASMPYHRLSLSERAKPHIYALNKEGKPYAPAWAVFHINSQFLVLKRFLLHLNIENLLDKRYKTYSSGLVSPGRGINGGFSFKF